MPFSSNILQNIMIQKLLANNSGIRKRERGGRRGGWGGRVGMGGGARERGHFLAFLYGLGSFSKMVFSPFFYHSHCPINVAVIISSYYFLKIVELWWNSPKRKKAKKREEGRTSRGALPDGMARASPIASGLSLKPLQGHSMERRAPLTLDLLGNSLMEF